MHRLDYAALILAGFIGLTAILMVWQIVNYLTFGKRLKKKIRKSEDKLEALIESKLEKYSIETEIKLFYMLGVFFAEQKNYKEMFITLFDVISLAIDSGDENTLEEAFKAIDPVITITNPRSGLVSFAFGPNEKKNILNTISKIKDEDRRKLYFDFINRAPSVGAKKKPSGLPQPQ